MQPKWIAMGITHNCRPFNTIVSSDAIVNYFSSTIKNTKTRPGALFTVQCTWEAWQVLLPQIYGFVCFRSKKFTRKGRQHAPLVLLKLQAYSHHQPETR